MEIIVIIGAVIVGAFLLKSSTQAIAPVAVSSTTPTPTVIATPAPAVAVPQPAPAIRPKVFVPSSITPIVTPAVTAPPTSQISSQGQQVTLQTLEAQIQALTPKPVDPLAPKPVSASTISILPTITATYTPEEALIEAKARETNLNPRDYSSGSALSTTLEGINLAQIKNMRCAAWDYRDGQLHWSGAYQPSQSLQLTGMASGMALTVTGQVAQSVGSSIASAIPFIGTVVNGIIGLFSAISRHHSQAVQRDATAWNVSLAAVDNYLAIIKNAVSSGQSTPDEGIQALKSMYSDFLTYTAPARNNNPYANSVTEAKISTDALCQYWEAYYTQLSIHGTGLGTVASPAPVAVKIVAPTKSTTQIFGPAAIQRLLTSRQTGRNV